MEGTRARIIELLQRAGRDTVDGLSTSMGLAPATIRRHLDILQRDRLVAYKEVRKKTGRPEYSYYLTDAGHESLPKAYDRLLSMLVAEVEGLTAAETSGRDGQQVLETVFRRLSDRVLKGHEGQLTDSEPPYRLALLMSHLKQDGFAPETEALEGVVHIRLLNCPFRAVALRHTAVCNFDLNLISSMLNTPVVREGCIHDGDSHCTYTAAVPTAQPMTAGA